MSEEMVIRCCAPTLAAIKTGSLFNCPFGSRQEMTESLRALNLCLLRKGVTACKRTGLWKVFERTSRNHSGFLPAAGIAPTPTCNAVANDGSCPG